MRTRIIGIVLLVIGLGFASWLATGLAEATKAGEPTSGYVLGLVLFSLPWFAVSIYLLLSSKGQIKEQSKADKQRMILSAVMTRGRVSVADLAIECDLTRDQVREYVYDIIGKDLFRGFVNWDKGELVSAEAAQIKADTCPNCGGKVELAGKGLVRCPYCGTETYLSAPTSGVKAVHSKEPTAPAAPPSAGATPPAAPPGGAGSAGTASGPGGNGKSGPSSASGPSGAPGGGGTVGGGE